MNYYFTHGPANVPRAHTTTHPGLVRDEVRRLPGREHFTMDDRVPEHNVYGNLRTYGDAKYKQSGGKRPAKRAMYVFKPGVGTVLHSSMNQALLDLGRQPGSRIVNTVNAHRAHVFEDGSAIWDAKAPWPEFIPQGVAQ